jgi:sialidase-1
MKPSCCLAAAVAATILSTSALADPWATEVAARQAVFTSGGKAAVGRADAAHTFRIPAVVVTKAGTLLAFAEARRDGGGDTGAIDTVVRRSTDGGQTFGPLQVVAAGQGDVMGNPAPVALRSGRIMLLTTWNSARVPEGRTQPGLGADSRRVFVCHSDDDGLTWTTPREITVDVKRAAWSWYATGPGEAIQLARGKHAGRIVVPCNHREAGIDRSHVITSDDEGATWRLGGVTVEGTNESRAVELADGGVMLNSRNHRSASKQRAVSISADSGDSFDPTRFRRDPVLIEPHCQAALARHSWPAAGQPGLLLFSNPASETRRERLTLRGSRDDGTTWPLEHLVHPGGSAYSDLAVLPDGRVAVLYEKDGYRSIELVLLSLAANPAAKPTAAEAQAQAAAWLDRLGDRGLVLDATLAEPGFVVRQGASAVGRVTKFELDQAGYRVSFTFRGEHTAATPPATLREQFWLAVIDRVPTPGFDLPGWETRPLTPTSSFDKGVELVSLADGWATFRVQAEFFALSGRDPAVLVPADAPAPPGSFFQLRRRFPLDLTISAPVAFPR